MSISVRQASITDTTAISALLISMVHEMEGILVPERKFLRRTGTIISKPKKGRYFVAESDGRVVACLLVVPEWDMIREKSTWWITDVYVHPEYRRVGICSEMLEYIAATAKHEPSLIPLSLKLIVDKNNMPARMAYGKIFFNDSKEVIMELSQHNLFARAF